MHDDAHAIEELVRGYATAADIRDREGYAAVFADDGVLVTHRGTLRGHNQLLTAVDGLVKYDQTKHTITGHELTTIEGDEAAAQTWCTAEHMTIGDVCVETYVLTIRYDDRFRRIDGVWRIAERTLNVLSEERRQGD